MPGLGHLDANDDLTGKLALHLPPEASAWCRRYRPPPGAVHLFIQMRRGTINLRVRLRTVMIPRSGLDREGLTSNTSLSTSRLSPGRVGFGQSSSTPAPTIPSASGKPPSTSRRAVIAAVCQPLAAKPENRVSLAASLSR